MSDDYLWDKSGEVDPEVARLERALSPLKHEGEWRAPAEAHPKAAAADPKAAAADPKAIAADPKIIPLDAARVQASKRASRRFMAAAVGAAAIAAAAALWIVGLQRGPDPSGPQALVSSKTALPVVSTAGPPPSKTAICADPAVGFAFEATGPVLCAGAKVSAGYLPAGEWLETAEGASANIKVADIGAITLGESSKLRVVGTGASEHRLELLRGSLHAKVKAPPRLFVIDTRAATAVDLGCEYDLRVDGEGRSHLHVTWGAVSLEGRDRVAYVPAGARVTADLDRGPGSVIADSAGAPLIDAAARFDRGEAGALKGLLSAASRADSVTLWNLLAGTPRPARDDVLKRMEELALRPPQVKREALLSGSAEAMEALREHLEGDWFEPTPTPTPPRVTW